MPLSDDDFRTILNATGLSWRGFRKVRKGVKKKIERHLQALSCENVEQYLKIIRHDPAQRQEFERITAVTISRFFRDKNLWQVLETRLIPALMVMTPSGPIRVWSVGCACGEEVYSFKVVWERLRQRLPHLPPLQLLATDISTPCLQRARKGVYSRSSLKEVSTSILKKYFWQLNPKTYAVKDFLKSNIQWREHNFLREPFPGENHLLFTRNSIFTYFQGELQKQLLEKLSPSLVRGGFLILGSHESLPTDAGSFFPMFSTKGIYRKGWGHVVLFSGPPASGKSALLRLLQQELKERCLILQTDDFKHHPYQHLWKEAEKRLGCVDYLLLEGTFYKETHRQEFRKFPLPVKLIYLKCGLEECLKRNLGRKDRIPEPAVVSLTQQFEVPQADLVIDTEQLSLSQSQAMIKNFLQLF